VSTRLRASGLIATGTLLSRLTGLVRVWATAHALGVTALADTYNSANSTPNLVYELVLGGVLTATLVPLFVEAREHREPADNTVDHNATGNDPPSDDDRERDTASSAIFTMAAIVLLGITALALLLAPAIVRLLTLRVPAADRAEALALGTALVRCFVPQIIGYGFTALAAAALNARGRFAAAAYAPVLNNVVVTVVLLAVARDEPTLATAEGDRSLTLLLGLGTTAGILAMAGALVPALIRAGIRLRWTFAPRHPIVTSMLRRSGWTVGYVIANQIALLFVMVLARDDAGNLAAYQYAFVFFQLPHGLFAVSIMTAWLPDLARRARAGDLVSLRAQFDAGLRAVLLLVIPSAVGYLALSLPIVHTLLASGSDVAPGRTAAALTGFALGLVPFSVYLYTMRAFYALGDTRTPFFANASQNLLNITFALPAYAWWGVRGLAGAYSAAYLLAAIGSLAVLRRRIGPVAGRRVLRLTTVSGFGAAICGAGAYAVARALDGPVMAAIAGTAVGVVLYLAVIASLARNDLRGLRASEPAVDNGELPGARLGV